MPDVPEDKRDETGLQYVHPDLCYGVPSIVGAFIYSLKNRLFDPDTTDFM